MTAPEHLVARPAASSRYRQSGPAYHVVVLPNTPAEEVR